MSKEKIKLEIYTSNCINIKKDIPKEVLNKYPQIQIQFDDIKNKLIEIAHYENPEDDNGPLKLFGQILYTDCNDKIIAIIFSKMFPGEKETKYTVLSYCIKQVFEYARLNDLTILIDHEIGHDKQKSRFIIDDRIEKLNIKELIKFREDI